MNKVDLMGVKDKNAFSAALKTTKHGDSIRYHTGYYAGGLFKHDALMAAEARLVNLVQKKLGAGLFQYIAQRTKKRFNK
tara:strand:- start:160 stop:396 length:237 start_codon:yes stop_codon:yes gene_type:complete